MALFSRRTLQRLVDENASFLSKSQTKELVHRLNLMPTELSLSHEWEVVLLNAFSKIGKVYYEKNFGGERTPDVYFEIPDGNFVADITAVSDKGLNQINPIDQFRGDFFKIAAKNELKLNCFNITVGSRNHGPVHKGCPKVQLKIPGSARLSQIIFEKEDFNEFIEAIQKNPKSIQSYSIDNENADVKISYNPNQLFASSSHQCYTEIYSKTENTIYSALSDKGDQLARSNCKGPLGIFLCDGGCSYFRRKSTQGFSYSINDVILDFLKNNKHISFVTTFVPTNNNPHANAAEKKTFSIFIHTDKGLTFDKITFDFQGVLNKVAAILPKPESDSQNAINLLKFGKPFYSRSNYGGGMNMGAKKIKISARALQELLAGRMGQEQFLKDHGFISAEHESGHIANPFGLALNRGDLIYNTTIEKITEADDDWIIFELKGPDPAISQFKVPKL